MNGQFEKGQSGNPAGRPKKGNAIADLINERLSTEYESGQTYKAALVNVLFDLAIKDRDIRAISKIMDSIESDYQFRERISIEDELERIEKILNERGQKV